MAYIRWSSNWVKPLKGNCPCPYYMFWDRGRSGCGGGGVRCNQILTVMILSPERPYMYEYHKEHFTYVALVGERKKCLSRIGVMKEEIDAVNALFDKFITDVEEKYRR